MSGFKVWWFILAVLATVLASIGAVLSPYLTFGAIAGIALIALGIRFPIYAVGLWMIGVAFIPSWTYVYVAGVSLSPAPLLGVPILGGILLSRRRAKRRLTWADSAFATGIICVAVLALNDAFPQYVLSNLFFMSGIAYILGRYADSISMRQFGTIMVVVSIWGIFEFLTGVHLFEQWLVSDSHTLNEIQERGGLARSEAAMGHAIAFGACLALAIPFVRLLKRNVFASQLVLIVGIIVSLSRGPMLALVLTLGLSAIALTQGAKRMRAILGVLVGIVLVYVVFDLLYGGEAANEVTGSGAARITQIEAAFSLINFFGPADGLMPVDGALEIAGMTIIDSTPLRFAINFGWIVMLLLLTPVLVAVCAFLRSQAGPASVALLGQIPIFVVTSMITQWQAFFFFIAGMVITEWQCRRSRSREDPSVILEAGDKAVS